MAVRFSIVTPAFNAARYLSDMLDSVTLQSFRDWELRIVDDGSTDETRSIIETASKADKRIKPLFLNENSGSCYLPRRRAIETAEGEFIVNIDADDTVEQDYLAKLDKRINETGADLVYADMWIDGKKFIPTGHPYDRTYVGRDIFIRSLDRWEVSGVAATSRRLTLSSLKRFDSEFDVDYLHGYFDDENLSRLDLFLASRVAFADASYFYRMVEGSITHQISPGKFNLLNADVGLVRFVAKHFGMKSREYALANRQLFHHVIEFMRILNRHRGLASTPASDITKKAFSKIDFNALRGIVSPRYYLLLRTGYFTSKLFLKLYGGEKG